MKASLLKKTTDLLKKNYSENKKMSPVKEKQISVLAKVLISASNDLLPHDQEVFLEIVANSPSRLHSHSKKITGKKFVSMSKKVKTQIKLNQELISFLEKGYFAYDEIIKEFNQQSETLKKLEKSFIVMGKNKSQGKKTAPMLFDEIHYLMNLFSKRFPINKKARMPKFFPIDLLDNVTSVTPPVTAKRLICLILYVLDSQVTERNVLKILTKDPETLRF